MLTRVSKRKKNVSMSAEISNRVRKLRGAMHLSQEEFAHQLGVSRNYVSMIEGGREPSANIVKLIELLESKHLGKAPDGPRTMMRQARLKKGLSFSELAKITRFRADVLQAIEEGTGQAPEKAIEAISEALGLDKAELMAGQDESIVRDALIGTYGAKPDFEVVGGGRVKYVPLLSMAQAGVLGATAFTDEAYDRSGVIAFDVKDPKAFGLRITGDSMEKRYPAGSVAIVYPSHKPRPGRPVIARLKEESGGGVLFKYYNPTEGGRRVTLTSENYQIHPEANYGIEEFEWIYPVANVVIEV
jgi:transcriptional regulator with XRE-family HTH domain